MIIPGLKSLTVFILKIEKIFFVIFASEEGPKLYFKDNVYQLRKDLHISLKEMDTVREFRIEEYNICIKYRTSPYIGFDVWSDQEDVDLFYQIEQSYKNDEYYKKIYKIEFIGGILSDSQQPTTLACLLI